jgi:hypothetical protein
MAKDALGRVNGCKVFELSELLGHHHRQMKKKNDEKTGGDDLGLPGFLQGGSLFTSQALPKNGLAATTTRTVPKPERRGKKEEEEEDKEAPAAEHGGLTYEDVVTKWRPETMSVDKPADSGGSKEGPSPAGPARGGGSVGGSVGGVG